MSNQEAENRRNQVDRYVNGEMDTEEITVFEQRMRENGALAEEVHLHRDVLMGMNHYFNADLKRILQEEEARLKKKPANFYKWAGIAASIILVVAVSYLFFNEQTDPQQVYAHYYKPYPNVVTPAQRSENETANLILDLYEAGNYSETLTNIEEQISRGDQASYLVFYGGIAALNTNEETKAINYFEKVINRQDETFANAAQWYIGLAYLKAGQIKKATQIFEEVKASGNDYSQRAADILKDL